jgi:hypothetical protein
MKSFFFIYFESFFILRDKEGISRTNKAFRSKNEKKGKYL